MLNVRHFFCDNDWLPARYLLIIEHYEIFFVWLCLICTLVDYCMRAVQRFQGHHFLLFSPLTVIVISMAQCRPQVSSSSGYINGLLCETGCWRETASSVLAILPGRHFAAITASSQAALAFSLCCQAAVFTCVWDSLMSAEGWVLSLALERGHMPVTHSQFIKDWLSALRSEHRAHLCHSEEACALLSQTVRTGGMEPLSQSLYICL